MELLQWHFEVNLMKYFGNENLYPFSLFHKIDLAKASLWYQIISIEWTVVTPKKNLNNVTQPINSMSLLKCPQTHNQMERKPGKVFGFLAWKSTIYEFCFWFCVYCFFFFWNSQTQDWTLNTGSNLMFSQATIAVTMKFEFHHFYETKTRHSDIKQAPNSTICHTLKVFIGE